MGLNWKAVTHHAKNKYLLAKSIGNLPMIGHLYPIFQFYNHVLPRQNKSIALPHHSLSKISVSQDQSKTWWFLHTPSKYLLYNFNSQTMLIEYCCMAWSIPVPWYFYLPYKNKTRNRAHLPSKKFSLNFSPCKFNLP